MSTATMNATMNATNRIEELLGAETAKSLLDHKCETISKDLLHLPGGDFV